MYEMQISTYKTTSSQRGKKFIKTISIVINFLKKYFLISNEMYEVRRNSGYCINKNCSAYMKNQ